MDTLYSFVYTLYILAESGDVTGSTSSLYYGSLIQYVLVL